VMGKKTASKKKEGSKYAIWEKAKRERKARQKFCAEVSCFKQTQKSAQPKVIVAARLTLDPPGSYAGMYEYA
jgi:hypothetical protein